LKHDPLLANQLIIRSLEAKIAKLTERVAKLESRRPRGRRQPRTSRAPDPASARVARPILDRAAYLHGCTVAEICGSRGGRRVILARAEAAYECGQAGLSSVQTGLVIGGRDHTTILNLHRRHKERLGIE
jgi:chromosomal replication initiation ATPase DnaA